MDRRIHRSLRRQKQLAMHWMMAMMSFATISWIAFRTMGG